MLKKVLKWTGILIGSLLIIILIFFAIAYFNTESRAHKVYDVQLQQLTIPSDSASLALGEHIAAVRGCTDCHGNGGKILFDEKNPVVFLPCSNITTGKGGIQYTDQDWVRALRHGLNKDNQPLWFMPAQHTSAALSNQELGALISYLKQLKPVDTNHPAKELKPLGRILTFLKQFPLFPAEEIDHKAVPPEMVKVEVNAAYGRYLAVGCMGCHGPQFKGGPGHGPGEPPILDISSTGRISKWSMDEFITTIRTGHTPDGRVLSDFMPWKTMGSAHTDDELKAIYLYLKEAK